MRELATAFGDVGSRLHARAHWVAIDGIGNGADQSQLPPVDEHRAIRHLPKCDRAARTEPIEHIHETDVFELDVAERARRRIDPQRAFDVDAVALATLRFESQPNLHWPIPVRRHDSEAVADRET